MTTIIFIFTIAMISVITSYILFHKSSVTVL